MKESVMLICWSIPCRLDSGIRYTVAQWKHLFLLYPIVKLAIVFCCLFESAISCGRHSHPLLTSNQKPEIPPTLIIWCQIWKPMHLTSVQQWYLIWRHGAFQFQEEGQSSSHFQLFIQKEYRSSFILSNECTL